MTPYEKTDSFVFYCRLNTVECAEPSVAESELAEHLNRLPSGQHLCLFYEKDPAEQLPALVPFIKKGLAENEQIIYIADDQTVDELAFCLEQKTIDVAEETQRGSLRLWTRSEWRQPGELDSRKKAVQVRSLIQEASAAGFSGIRFGIEMTHQFTH